MGRSASAPCGAAAAVLAALLLRQAHGSHESMGGMGRDSLTHFALEIDTGPSAQHYADFFEVATELLPSDCGDRSVPRSRD